MNLDSELATDSCARAGAVYSKGAGVVLIIIGIALIISSAFSGAWRITELVVRRWVRLTAPLSTDMWADSWGIDRQVMRNRVVQWSRWFSVVSGLFLVAAGASPLLRTSR